MSPFVKIQGAPTQAALKKFDLLFVLICSTTQRTKHDTVYALDAFSIFLKGEEYKRTVEEDTSDGISVVITYLIFFSGNQTDKVMTHLITEAWRLKQPLLTKLLLPYP